MGRFRCPLVSPFVAGFFADCGRCFFDFLAEAFLTGAWLTHLSLTAGIIRELVAPILIWCDSPSSVCFALNKPVKDKIEFINPTLNISEFLSFLFSVSSLIFWRYLKSIPLLE